MNLRAIYLSTPQRINELESRNDFVLERSWLRQFVFELSHLTEAERSFYQKNRTDFKKILDAKSAGPTTLFLHVNDLFFHKSEWQKFTRHTALKHRSNMPPTWWEFFRRALQFFSTGSDIAPYSNRPIFDLQAAPLIMGILNVTPDSFSDGGKYVSTQAAVSHALQMVEAGAHIIDVGGESTRPGAQPVASTEEIRRTVPVIRALRERSDVLISIDTYKSDVAELALEAGADMVNDISGLTYDKKMIALIRESACPVIVMHIVGTPRDMQKNPVYDDVVGEIYRYFEERIDVLERNGIRQIILDPGIGFGKRLEDNLRLIRDLRDFTFLGKPLLIGASRKSFIGQVLDKPVNLRLPGTLTANLLACQNGAHIVRVHDVAEMHQALMMNEALLAGKIKN